jgi:hypothetical protein
LNRGPQEGPLFISTARKIYLGAGMPLFNFELKPLHAVLPWGEPDDLKLHWFGLTDGCCHLDVKGHELFRYSEEMIAHWYGAQADAESPYNDYQVVRLYEDILYILPEVIEPIPAHVFAHFEDPDSWERLFACLARIRKEGEERWIEHFNPIGGLLSERYLDTGYLVQGPDIWFLRNGDLLHIRWRNQDKQIDGIPVWKESKGDVTLPLDEFMREVRAFHEDLMSRMAARIVEVKAGKLNPKIRIDIKHLEAEQRERSGALEAVLSRRGRDQAWEALDGLFRELEAHSRRLESK